MIAVKEIESRPHLYDQQMVGNYHNINFRAHRVCGGACDLSTHIVAIFADHHTPFDITSEEIPREALRLLELESLSDFPLFHEPSLWPLRFKEGMEVSPTSLRRRVEYLIETGLFE